VSKMAAEPEAGLTIQHDPVERLSKTLLAQLPSVQAEPSRCGEDARLLDFVRALEQVLTESGTRPLDHQTQTELKNLFTR